jgi:hypothetical protein
MLPVAVHDAGLISSGIADADDEAGGVALGLDVADVPLLEVGVGPAPVGSLLSRLTVSRVATIVSAPETPMTIQVAAPRRRSVTASVLSVLG